MLRRVYIVLIAGAALLSAGIVISVLWAESFAHQFVRENAIINETLLRPHSFALATLEVKDIERNVTIYPQPDHIIVFVTDPNNTTVKFTSVKLNPYLNHITFKPESAGKYTLHIMNNSSKDVNFNKIFGYVPMTIENDQTDVNLLNGIFVGSSLVVSGIITLIIGIIFVILGRSTQRQSVTP